MNSEATHKAKSTIQQTAAASHTLDVGTNATFFLEDNRTANAIQRKPFSDASKTGTIQLAKGKKQRAEKKAAKKEKEEKRAEEKEEKRKEDDKVYGVARAKTSRKARRIQMRQQQEAEEEARRQAAQEEQTEYDQSRAHLETDGHESTHRNLFTKHARRNSLAEADLLDTINPAGAPIPDAGLNLADFRARFHPLVQAGNISAAAMSALLPTGKAIDFPPARQRDQQTEIRAGRKWEIPNPDGGTHAIWTHTNDPTQDAGQHSGAGPVVRVRDSSGKFLSDQALNAPQRLVDQRQARVANGRDTAEIDTAIANKTGSWTTPDADRADNQHIPLV